MNDLEITPRELANLREKQTAFRLIDVREPYEVKIACLPGSEEIPMGLIPSRLQSLENGGAPIVVICHHGVRSLQVVCWLREQGIENCRSLAGGIERWSQEIDPRIPRY